MRVLLFSSLALNLLIVGVVGGLIWNFREGPSRDSRDYAAPYVFALDPSDRRALRRSARNYLSDPRAARRQSREDYQAIIRTLTTEPFDRDAAARILVRQTEIARDRRVAGQEALLDHWDGMSAADRALYAARLEEVLKKGARRPSKAKAKQ